MRARSNSKASKASSVCQLVSGHPWPRLRLSKRRIVRELGEEERGEQWANFAGGCDLLGAMTKKITAEQALLCGRERAGRFSGRRTKVPLVGGHGYKCRKRRSPPPTCQPCGHTTSFVIASEYANRRASSRRALLLAHHRSDNSRCVCVCVCVLGKGPLISYR